ncbi:YgdI/YgdR family lipoprotein, partial [Leptospira borgpetersenii serovar Hardjo-bovis]|nr:YgdI/YgdR family lipoprotein [Leptospira borgpetersenii serovar Hardjo-bovis]
DGNTEVDNDPGMVSYKIAATGKTEHIIRDQLKNMSELDN